MKVLVIVGTGYIGTHVVRRLIGGGHGVTVFHRGRTNSELSPDVRQILGDRRRLSDFKDEFKRFSPEVVLDMTPYVEEDAFAVVQTFRGVAGRVVAVSSQDVYRSFGLLWRRESSPPNVTPISENAPLRTVLHLYRPMAKGEDDFKFTTVRACIGTSKVNKHRVKTTFFSANTSANRNNFFVLI